MFPKFEWEDGFRYLDSLVDITMEKANEGSIATATVKVAIRKPGDTKSLKRMLKQLVDIPEEKFEWMCCQQHDWYPEGDEEVKCKIDGDHVHQPLKKPKSE